MSDQSRPEGMPELSYLPPQEETEYCYGHPDTPTRLHCSRCDRPICGRCAIPASVGQHCPECVAEARRSQPRIRSAIRGSAPAVTTILVINVAMFFAQQLVPGLTERLLLFEPSIASGEWWRLLTPVVLHGSAFHLIMNSLVLWIYGPDVEGAFGTRRFLALYLVAGLAGSVASYGFGSCPQPSVGASGAIFGMVGGMLVYLYRRRNSALVQQYMRGILFFVGINLLFGFALSGVVDNAAHVGGLVGGALVGLGLDGGRKLNGAPLMPVLSVALVIALTLGVFVWRTGALDGVCF